MASIFGAITVETPKSTILKAALGGMNNCEIRQYEKQIRATVELPHKGPMDRDLGNPFRTLAGFIFGGNTKRSNPEAGNEKIAMTGPVMMSQKKESEKVAMTSPVLVSAPTKPGEESTIKMSFVMPSKFTSVDELPVPKDAKVQLEEVPAYKVAVIKFSGSFAEASFKKHEQLLREAVAKDGEYKLSTNPDDVIVAGYNPPWCLPWCKTNEVHIPVV